jgi:crotonobetainyl-CoA:carnitine CoA-transferase CaiB-like acyl-CoA transferase
LLLADVTVVEYAQFVAGPFCGKLLAGLGAEVIKVEPPGGDPARRRGPFLDRRPGPESSALFLYLNTGKKGVTLNPQLPTGRDLFLRLLGLADVLIVDLTASELARLGLECAGLKERFPRLILVSITPFGSEGPRSGWKAYELNLFHGGGEGYLLPNGLAYELAPGRGPLKAGGYLAQYEAGVAGAAAALAALYAREFTGRGQHVDVSIQEVQLNLNIMAVNRYLNGTLETRANRSFRYGGVLPCRDGYVELLTLEQHQWEALVELMGNPEWASDERFKDPIGRARHGAEINARLREWSRRYTRDELYRLAQERGIPVGPYYDAGEVVNSEHERERGFFAPVEHPFTGPALYPTWPFRFSPDPPPAPARAPLLGEHNGEIFGRRLGLPAREIARLAANGVV